VAMLRDSGPSLCPGAMPQGVSYVRYDHKLDNLYIRNIMSDNVRRSATTSPAAPG
jgi:hypothetical protein